MTDDNLLGTQLDEYRLETLLGQGGMARVYRAIDVRLQRYAALKVIDLPLRTDPEYTTRFEREAQAIAKLEHPNIVGLYRYGEAHDLLYMAMQYVEGTDLAFVLDSYRADGEYLESEEAGRIIRQLCSALDYAHSKGVIHRDVKPSNIMLDRQGQAYLADFGLALLTDVGTRGEIFGSPHYIAPEQAISSAGAGPKSDLYSVGIILYEMFTGQWPFNAENPMDIAMMHMTDDPQPPRALRPDLSPDVEAVILKAIAKEPDDRYANGAALAEALERALEPKQPETWAAPTAARQTIPERIAVEMADNPLPPLPAAVTPRPAGPTVEYAGHPDQPVMLGSAAINHPEPGSPFRQRSFQLACAGVSALLLLIACTVIALLLLRGDDDDDNNDDGEQPETQAADVVTPEPGTLTPSPFPSVAATITSPPTLTPLVLVPNTTPVVPAPTIGGLVPETSSGGSDYQIVILTVGDDSLVLVNQTARRALPLAPLQLGDGDGMIDGSEWGVGDLQPGACVTAWKDGGNPKSPQVSCTHVGEDILRDGPKRFWKKDFNVYYNGARLGECEGKLCSFTIPG